MTRAEEIERAAREKVLKRIVAEVEAPYNPDHIDVDRIANRACDVCLIAGLQRAVKILQEQDIESGLSAVSSLCPCIKVIRAEITRLKGAKAK